MHRNHLETHFLRALLLSMLGVSAAQAESPGWRVGLALADGRELASDHPIDTDRGYELQLGYAVNEHWTAVLAYHDFGNMRHFGSPCPPTSEVCIAVAVVEHVEQSGVSLRSEYQWNHGRWHPFVGAGMNWVEIDANAPWLDRDKFGLTAEAGTDLDLNGALALRASYAWTPVFEGDGAFQLGVLLRF